MQQLRSYLEASRMTQHAFAEAVGVSQPTVNRWLRGKARPSWQIASVVEDVTAGAVPVSAWAGHFASPSTPDLPPED